ncbi:MAG: hypothetical protein JWR26_3839, partial [Pedosphaera sp.]|nr:hypothetical protein [Pedosphaera sp.]
MNYFIAPPKPPFFRRPQNNSLNPGQDSLLQKKVSLSPLRLCGSATLRLCVKRPRSCGNLNINLRPRPPARIQQILSPNGTFPAHFWTEMNPEQTSPKPKRRSLIGHALRWPFGSLLQFTIVAVPGIVLLIVLFYAEENWRGKLAWEQCKQELAAKGKTIDWLAYVPAPIPGDDNFYDAPKMRSWFVGRGGNELSGYLGLNNFNAFIGESNSNAAAEVTIVSPDAEVPADQADIVLDYRPPVLTLALPQMDASATNQDPIIPRLTMADVPLSDAITNLARQAGLTFMLDPKLASVQSGQPGVSVLQQTVSFQWTNVTARAALRAILDNYQLAMLENSTTHVARIVFNGNGRAIVETDVHEQLRKLLQAAIDKETNAIPGKSTMGAQGYMLFKDFG